jgi:hypothetical protein
MLDVASIYGPPDPKPTLNAYAQFQSVSGSRLDAGGPTTQTDQSAYGNNQPNFYTTQDANLNNAGPPSIYQQIQPGYGEGVSAQPSQFSPAYYLRVFNRGNSTIRVAKGHFSPNGMPVFAAPASVDDSTLLTFDQATSGMKFPLLFELPSKALYFRVITIPTGQNQLVNYAPFETELRERSAPSANIAGVTVYADNLPELRVVTAYLAQFQSGNAPQPTPSHVSAYQNAQGQTIVNTPLPPAPRPAQPAAQPTMRATAPATKEPSLLTSAALLIGGVLATHYLSKRDKNGG